MKHGKKPTRQEKLLLVKSGYDPLGYLTFKRLSKEVHFIDKNNSSILIIPM